MYANPSFALTWYADSSIKLLPLPSPWLRRRPGLGKEIDTFNRPACRSAGSDTLPASNLRNLALLCKKVLTVCSMLRELFSVVVTIALSSSSVPDPGGFISGDRIVPNITVLLGKRLLPGLIVCLTPCISNLHHHLGGNTYGLEVTVL